jgi:hypothetical protein
MGLLILFQSFSRYVWLQSFDNFLLGQENATKKLEWIENHFVHPIVWKEQSGNWHEMCLSRVIVTIDHRLSKNLVGIHNMVNSFLKSNLNS